MSLGRGHKGRVFLLQRSTSSARDTLVRQMIVVCVERRLTASLAEGIHTSAGSSTYQTATRPPALSLLSVRVPDTHAAALHGQLLHVKSPVFAQSPFQLSSCLRTPISIHSCISPGCAHLIWPVMLGSLCFVAEFTVIGMDLSLPQHQLVIGVRSTEQRIILRVFGQE